MAVIEVEIASALVNPLLADVTSGLGRVRFARKAPRGMDSLLRSHAKVRRPLAAAFRFDLTDLSESEHRFRALFNGGGAITLKSFACQYSCLMHPQSYLRTARIGGALKSHQSIFC